MNKHCEHNPIYRIQGAVLLQYLCVNAFISFIAILYCMLLWKTHVRVDNDRGRNNESTDGNHALLLRCIQLYMSQSMMNHCTFNYIRKNTLWIIEAELKIRKLEWASVCCLSAKGRWSLWWCRIRALLCIAMRCLCIVCGSQCRW